MADRSSSKDSASGPASSGPGPSGSGSRGATDSSAPGLGEQFGRTRQALVGLIRSHINLAKAEFAEIAGEIKRAVALGGIALLLLFLAGTLIAIGTLLFLGEWIFGSIGWGLLDGAELLLGAAALLIFAIIDLGWRRGIGSLLVALGVGLVVAGLLATDWSYVSRHYSGLPSGWVLAIGAGAVLIGGLGAVLGSGFGRGATFAGFVAGAMCGVLLGMLAAIGPGPRVAAAVGLAAVLLFWPIVAAYLVFRHGIDTKKLRARFVPEVTIETTKETIEWVREQMPLGRKS